MGGDRAMFGLEGFRDFLGQDVQDQHLRGLLKEIPLTDKIVDRRECKRDDGADVEHKEPGYEPLGQFDR